MELLCGKCSQEQGLSLKERMELAKSRMPNVNYFCPVCEQEHSYRGVEEKAAPPQPTKEKEESPRKSREKTQDDEQLSLF